MRISDWSSDVCSSDLVGELLPPLALMRRRHAAFDGQAIVEQEHALACPMPQIAMRSGRNAEVAPHFLIEVDAARRRPRRSEERRVGKECVSPCRSRWSPYH